MGNANQKKDARKTRAKREQTPKPAYPCEKCLESKKATLGVCNGGFGICKENLEYQRLLWELKNMEGD